MTDNKDKVLPSPSFSNLILSIASTALIKMGLDSTNKTEKNLDLARYNIDLLELVRQKTKNNLTKEETELLDSCISDLQIQFVNLKNEEKKGSEVK